MDLFPEIKPFDSGYLSVSDLHEIHYEQCGNPTGLPIVYVHGGPGAGLSESARRFFDPDKWRVILFSQRGSGFSRPFAELRNNTTWHLIEDMEALRVYLNIDKWTLFGGSWGSTLSLIYAIKYPDRCSSLILRGIFLSREKELHWLYQDGASKIFPDYFEDFLSPIEEQKRAQVIASYYELLTHEDETIRLNAAKAWSVWEGRISRLIPNAESISNYEDLKFAEAFARIECHYFINGSFLPNDNYILENIASIDHLPTSIVQGRYDIVCPFDSAWELHKRLPNSKLIISQASGHSASEPDVLSSLMTETERHYRLVTARI